MTATRSGVVGRETEAVGFLVGGVRGWDVMLERGNVCGADGLTEGLPFSSAEEDKDLVCVPDATRDKVPRFGGVDKGGTPLLPDATTVLRLVSEGVGGSGDLVSGACGEPRSLSSLASSAGGIEIVRNVSTTRDCTIFSRPD